MNASDKHAAAVKFPPPLLPVITIIIGNVLSRFIPFLDGWTLPTPWRYWIGGLFTVAVVLVFGVWPIRQFNRSGQDVKPWTPTPEIVTSGPFGITRNPMYVMMVLACVGFAIILSDVWTLILAPVCGWAIYLVAIRHEEAYLEERFGDAYREYKQRVRRWI